MSNTEKAARTSQTDDTDALNADYLTTLERVKKQYERYVEVTSLFELPTQRQPEETAEKPPSPEHPLTINRI